MRLRWLLVLLPVWGLLLASGAYAIRRSCYEDLHNAELALGVSDDEYCTAMLREQLPATVIAVTVAVVVVALLWAVLALPALWLLARWAGGASTYGEVVSRSGLWSALLLVPATLVTPLGLLFPQARWLAWLVRRRHDVGVACVAYAAAHATAYAIGKGSLVLILREARQPWLLAGWAALVFFLAFAVIRGRAAWRGAARDPRPSWTRRHRIIYAGGVLVVLHWAFSAFDPLTVQVQTALRAYGYYGGPIDGLIGPLPRERRRYEERSPLLHAGRASGPALLLHGLEDAIVPPVQAERFVAELDRHGTPWAYLTFPGEQHGWRREETIVAALEAELAFYGIIFGFPTPEVPPLRLRYPGGEK